MISSSWTVSYKDTASTNSLMDYKKHLAEKMKDPDFKREYEALAHEFDAFDVNEKVKQGLNYVRLMKERKIKPKTLKEFLRQP